MNTVEESPLVVSIKKTCALLNIGPTKAFALIKSGALETVKIGASTKVKMSSIRHVASVGAE